MKTLKRFLFFIVSLIILFVGLFASFGKFRENRRWTDDDCYTAFNQLWYKFGHENSSEDMFTMPDTWYGDHDNMPFRGMIVDPESLLGGLETHCSHLFEVTYIGNTTKVRRFEFSLSRILFFMDELIALPTEEMIRFVTIVGFTLLSFVLLLRKRQPRPCG